MICKDSTGNIRILTRVLQKVFESRIIIIRRGKIKFNAALREISKGKIKHFTTQRSTNVNTSILFLPNTKRFRKGEQRSFIKTKNVAEVQCSVV